MVDIFHQIAINGSPDSVFAALATQNGLAGWWTTDATAEEVVGGKAEFGFENRGVVFRMQIAERVPGKRVVWSCLGDPPEWNGTTLAWTIAPENGVTVLRFNQRWKAQTDTVAMCNSTWGELMYRIKDYVEGRNPGPRWTK
jgi:uncharacterized protein YndB with AHSA1/START domain